MRNTVDLYKEIEVLKSESKKGWNNNVHDRYIELYHEFYEKELWRESENALLELLRVQPSDAEGIHLLRKLHERKILFCDIRSGMPESEIQERLHKTVISDIPRIQLFIELTNHCNGKCVTCLNRKMKRKRGIMDFELFKDIVDRSCRELYLEMVHLYGVGESYLVGDVMKYFDYAVDRYSRIGVNTVLITNGEKISDLHHGISNVDISFNAGNKETYERITGISFDKTVRNIWRLEREGQLGPNVNIHMLVFRDNKDEIEDFKKLFAFTSANLVLAYKYDNQCGEIEDKTLDDFRRMDRIPCHYVRNVLNIGWNGDVILCPHDFDGVVNYGNVAEKSFSDIWYGEKHVEMLSKHTRGQFDGLCRHCNFNVPIEGQNVVVDRKERIELRKNHLDYALNEMVACARKKGCRFIEKYRKRIDEIEADESEPLVRICSDDVRFYGEDALSMSPSKAKCPELRRLLERMRNLQITWEAPTFGPSGYAYAARNYMTGLMDLGVKLKTQPIWGDCKMEFEDQKPAT